ncbi:uncharacterized protein G2W53_000806 [Senna tora]|uniref:Uncharacterized protein n=1 Tax=Senna tora TaxID=362788 RepID=A0A835CJT2_9FABA|nr:uncharacterized protein G2W53_000806 [Senna tora]
MEPWWFYGGYLGSYVMGDGEDKEDVRELREDITVEVMRGGMVPMEEDIERGVAECEAQKLLDSPILKRESVELPVLASSKWYSLEHDEGSLDEMFDTERSRFEPTGRKGLRKHLTAVYKTTAKPSVARVLAAVLITAVKLMAVLKTAVKLVAVLKTAVKTTTIGEDAQIAPRLSALGAKASAFDITGFIL